MMIITNGKLKGYGKSFFRFENKEKIFYDSISYSSQNEVDFSTMSYIINKYAPYAYNSILSDNYQYSKNNIEVFKNNQLIRSGDAVFNNVDSYITYINNNLEKDINGLISEQVIFRPYDIVNTKIPTFDKLYGMNNLYSKLRGRGRYLDNDKVLYHTNKWVERNNFLYNIINEFKPSMNLSNIFSTNDGYKLFWVKGNKNIYELPYSNTFYDVVNRYALDTTFSANPEVVLSSGRFIINNVKVFISRPDSSGSYNAISPTTEYNKKIIRREFNFLRTMIIVFELVNQSNPNIVSFYIKPLGIDTVNLNWFDNNKYILEAVYVDYMKQTLYFNKIESYNLMFNHYTDSVRVNMEFWNNRGGTNLLKVNKKSFNSYPVIGFRLRDINTGEVGNISRSFISLDFTGPYNPGRFLVL